ncbi:diguanylate cyclase [Candidatus Formimonas warabiya]|uniref:Stage 0 sporulation protein A homolog n=1 Tax=Formimonas warabiya TaxID=1761012 RepID=A0A3G1KWG5_FORW1|nr:diguanylate cyclase [Candidatus Formimonas warabiya]ATW26883.1 hypothetical protein DCMF_20840 [Candidatus Formimonas warabiya]
MGTNNNLGLTGIKRKVMIVDDSKFNLYLLKDMMEKAGYEVRTFTSGSQAITSAEKDPPDVILMDIIMPEIDGYEVCRRLKANDLLKDIPVIFLSANTDPFNRVKAFEVGGADYVPKPYNFEELEARVGLQLKLRQYQIELEEKNEELRQTLEQLEHAVQRLREMSVTDHLTQLANRRGIIEKIQNEIARYHRSKHKFSLIMCDIDHFKRINDTYGHECGDYILERIAALLKSSVRAVDSPARWGGEEFLLLLVETNYRGARVLAEKIRTKIASAQFDFKGNLLSVTMTFGVTEFDDHIGIDGNVANADQALYKGKERGRNCVVGFFQNQID